MRRLFVTLAATALLAGFVVARPAHAATAATATFAKTSSWDTGYQAQYTIKNTGTTTISGWTVEFDLTASTTVGTYWDALLSKSGDHYTFKNREYNGQIAPGATASFGFVASGTAAPSGCRLNGASCDGGSGGGDTQPPSAPSGLNVTGHTSSSVSLSWTAATDDTGVTGYDVFQGTTLATTASGTTATVTGLQPATTYTFKVRARDAAGNLSAFSAQVSATTDAGSPPPSGNRPYVAPYVDMGSWPTPVLSDMAQAGGLKGFTLAFVTSAGCKASWFNAYDPRAAWQKDEIDKLRAAGGDVKISFGGASGIELAQACTDVNSLYTEYAAVVDAYGAKYVDFDIEGAAVADKASVDRRSQALARLQQSHPGLRISLTLPVLPEGLTADGLNVVTSAENAGVDLDLVNVMAMDYYRSVDYGDAAVQAAQSTYDQLKTLYPGRTDAQLWAMVGVTPMLGQNDDHNVYNQDDARQLVTFAKQHHLGMLAFWEETRDRNACTGALYQCTNIPQQPYEFSKIFAPYTG
ncbi:hypothetical protein GCM10029978_068970 [Actinoallomurus acanthiterrae]